MEQPSPRIIRTKKSLEDALIELLQEKNVHKVTIKDLTTVLKREPAA
jgi:acid stress-induced BolA-like protein IbaG/YrbA